MPNACFFIKFINEGGGSNPFINFFAKVWYVMKKAKKGKKTKEKKTKNQYVTQWPPLKAGAIALQLNA